MSAVAEHLTLFETGVEQLEVNAHAACCHLPLACIACCSHALCSAARHHIQQSIHHSRHLQASARETAARRAELLAAARRLATELRGLDLLAGHVKSVDDLVKRLEAAAVEVLACGGATAAAGGSGGGGGKV